MDTTATIIFTLFSSLLLADDSHLLIAPKKNNIFEKYIGCYSTIKFNGNSIKEGSTGRSEFYNRNDSPFQDPETQDNLPSIGMMLYQGYNSVDDSDSYEFQYILTNRGKVFSDEAGDHFVFDGKLFYVAAGANNTIHIKYDLLPINKSQYQVNVYTRIDDYDWESNSSYVLEKTPCLHRI